MKLINIGFGNLVSSDKIVAVVAPESAPVKRIVQDAKQNNLLIDATCGRKCKSVIVAENNHVILSAISCEQFRTERTKVRKTRMSINRKGNLILFTGSSGVGKGTIIKELLDRDKNIRLSVSNTTREPREGEIDGVHYNF